MITRCRRLASMILFPFGALYGVRRTWALFQDRVQFHFYFMVLFALHFLRSLCLLPRRVLLLFFVHGHRSLFPRVQVFGFSTLQHCLPSCYTLCVVTALSHDWLFTVLFPCIRWSFHLNGLFILRARGNGSLRSGGYDWFLCFGCIFYVF